MKETILAALIGGLAGALFFVLLESDDYDCRRILAEWDAMTEAQLDCREDPDCALTVADQEERRKLVPRVAACESREGEE